MDIEKLKQYIKSLLEDINRVNREKAVTLHEWELNELRNIFALLVLGGFAGIPTPPVHITNALLPEMEDELQVMLNRINVAHDPIGELFSLLEIG